MAHVILERSFDPPLTDETLMSLNMQLAPCVERQGARWLRSMLSMDRRRMICEFEGPDAESIRSALRSARLEYDQVWSARVLSPETEASPPSASA